MHKRLGIVIVGTNSYLILAIRFIKRFTHFYRGDYKVTFYLFTEMDPKPYLPDNISVKFIKSGHKNWVEGTNSKFTNILSIRNDLREEDYIFYFDADTNVQKEFTEQWFIGDSVAGEHFGNQTFMKDNRPYERNPKSAAYIPEDTRFPQMYFYGAFFGGNYENMISMCKILQKMQRHDKGIHYEPGVNDESYLNWFFHYNPPDKIVFNSDFEFIISDKGGLGDTRHPNLDITEFKRKLQENKDNLIDIQNNQIIT